jgi:uncharacterized membrane protein (UPF0127 family)
MQRDSWGKWAIAIALLLVLVAGIIMVINISNRKTMVTVGSQTVYARVASTEQQRQRGLSGTAGLGDHGAMLFVFDAPGRWGMWMKDMRYSLDIVWIDSGRKVVYIAKNVSPDTYPRVFLPDASALYVLEVPAGFIASHNVAIGQVVGFTGY